MCGWSARTTGRGLSRDTRMPNDGAQTKAKPTHATWTAAVAGEAAGQRRFWRGPAHQSIQIGACGDQALHHLCFPLCRSTVQGRPVPLVGCVDIRASLNERLDRAVKSTQCRKVQRRILPGPLEVGIGAACEQTLHLLDVLILFELVLVTRPHPPCSFVQPHSKRKLLSERRKLFLSGSWPPSTQHSAQKNGAVLSCCSAWCPTTSTKRIAAGAFKKRARGQQPTLAVAVPCDAYRQSHGEQSPCDHSCQAVNGDPVAPHFREKQMEMRACTEMRARGGENSRRNVPSFPTPSTQILSAPRPARARSCGGPVQLCRYKSHCFTSENAQI